MMMVQLRQNYKTKYNILSTMQNQKVELDLLQEQLAKEFLKEIWVGSTDERSSRTAAISAGQKYGKVSIAEAAMPPVVEKQTLAI